jgi:hypothetical protein
MEFNLTDPVTGQIKSFSDVSAAEAYLRSINVGQPMPHPAVSSTPSTNNTVGQPMPHPAVSSTPSHHNNTVGQPMPHPAVSSTPAPIQMPSLVSTTTQFGNVDLIHGTPAIPTVPQETIDWGKAPSGYFYNAFGQLMREEAQIFDSSGKQINYIASPTGVYSPQINPSEANIRQIQTAPAFRPARITVSAGAPPITARTLESQEELANVAKYITSVNDAEELATERLLDTQVRPTRALPSWFETGRIPISDLDASGRYIGKPAPVSAASSVGSLVISQPTNIQQETPIASPRLPSGNMRYYSPSSTSKDEKNKILEQKLAGQPVAVAASLPSYYPDQRMTSVADGKVDIRLSKSDIERMNNGDELYFSILPQGGFDVTTAPVSGGTSFAMRHQDIDWSKSSVAVDLNKGSVAFNTNRGNFTLMSPEITGMDYYNKVIPVQKGNVSQDAGFYRAFLEPTGMVSEMDKANMQRQVSEDEWNRQVREFSQFKKDYTADIYAQKAAAYGQFQDVKDNRAAYEALGFKIQTDSRNNITSITPPSQEEFDIRLSYAKMGRPIPPNVNAAALKPWETPPLMILGQGKQSGIMGSMSENALAYIRSRKQVYNKNAFREVLMPKSKRTTQKRKRAASSGSSRSQGLIYPIPNLNPFKTVPKQTRKKVVKKKVPRNTRTTTKTKIEDRMSRNVNKFLGW